MHQVCPESSFQIFQFGHFSLYLGYLTTRLSYQEIWSLSRRLLDNLEWLVGMPLKAVCHWVCFNQVFPSNKSNTNDL